MLPTAPKVTFSKVRRTEDTKELDVFADGAPVLQGSMILSDAYDVIESPQYQGSAHVDAPSWIDQDADWGSVFGADKAEFSRRAKAAVLDAWADAQATSSPAPGKRSIVYARVSTAGQAATGHGLDAQLAKGRGYATAMGYAPWEDAIDAGVSGAVAPSDRPALGAALARLRAGEAQVLIVASLSRIGRRTLDVLELADQAQRESWGLVVLDLAMDTTTPTGRLALTVLAAVAELEREQLRQRTRDGLAAARAKGRRLGAPVHRNTLASGRRALALRGGGAKWREVVDVLRAEGRPYGPSGSTKWTLSMAHQAAKSAKLDADAARLRRA